MFSMDALIVYNSDSDTEQNDNTSLEPQLSKNELPFPRTTHPSEQSSLKHEPSHRTTTPVLVNPAQTSDLKRKQPIIVAQMNPKQS